MVTEAKPGLGFQDQVRPTPGIISSRAITNARAFAGKGDEPASQASSIHRRRLIGESDVEHRRRRKDRGSAELFRNSNLSGAAPATAVKVFSTLQSICCANAGEP
jgi:hypothetical protein